MFASEYLGESREVFSDIGGRARHAFVVMKAYACWFAQRRPQIGPCRSRSDAALHENRTLAGMKTHKQKTGNTAQRDTEGRRPALSRLPDRRGVQMACRPVAGESGNWSFTFTGRVLIRHFHYLEAGRAMSSESILIIGHSEIRILPPFRARRS